MITKTTKVNSVAEYISGFPKEVQKLLKELRATIIKTVPEAEEVISYQMPAYKYYGMLVYFAAYKNHIGFYPGVSPVEKYKKEIAIFKSSKGTVQFPLDKPLPIELILKMLTFKVKENLQKAQIKARKKF